MASGARQSGVAIEAVMRLAVPRRGLRGRVLGYGATVCEVRNTVAELAIVLRTLEFVARFQSRTK